MRHCRGPDTLALDTWNLPIAARSRNVGEIPPTANMVEHTVGLVQVGRFRRRLLEQRRGMNNLLDRHRDEPLLTFAIRDPHQHGVMPVCLTLSTPRLTSSIEVTRNASSTGTLTVSLDLSQASAASLSRAGSAEGSGRFDSSPAKYTSR